MIYVFDWSEVIKPWRRRNQTSLFFHDVRDGVFVKFEGVSIPKVCRVVNMEKSETKDWSEIHYKIEVRSWIPVEFTWQGYRGIGVSVLRSCFRIIGSSMMIDYQFLKNFYDYCVEKGVYEQYRFHFQRTEASLSVELE